jgi:hypothetical protein
VTPSIPSTRRGLRRSSTIPGPPATLTST